MLLPHCDVWPAEAYRWNQQPRRIESSSLRHTDALDRDAGKAALYRVQEIEVTI